MDKALDWDSGKLPVTCCMTSGSFNPLPAPRPLFVLTLCLVCLLPSKWSPAEELIMDVCDAWHNRAPRSSRTFRCIRNISQDLGVESLGGKEAARSTTAAAACCCLYLILMQKTPYSHSCWFPCRGTEGRPVRRRAVGGLSRSPRHNGADGTLHRGVPVQASRLSGRTVVIAI